MGVFSLSAFYYFGVISIISESVVALLFKSSHWGKKKKSHLFHNENPSIYSQTTSFKACIFYKAYHHFSIFLDKIFILLFASNFKLFSCYMLFFNLITASPCNYFLCCCNFPLVFFHSTLCGS